MKIPQVFQYQGSKRCLAPLIMEYLPGKCGRLVEPFAGSAALSIACAAWGRSAKFWLNDYNGPLADLLLSIIEEPEETAESYRNIWRGHNKSATEHYYNIRSKFNRTSDPKFLLYLLARCVKGSVRYNSDGLFNQSPDNRRLGTRPDTVRENLLAVSTLLKGKTTVTALDYRDVLVQTNSDDVVYMDPPYQGVCGDRDVRYLKGVAFSEFVATLEELNRRRIRFAISYDGRLGARTYGQPLPESLDLTLIELEAGRSTQATLLGRDDVTYESLYISAPLAKEIGAKPRIHARPASSQLFMMEGREPYGKVPKRVSRAL